MLLATCSWLPPVAGSHIPVLQSRHMAGATVLGGRCGGVPLGAAMVVFALWGGWWGAVVCKAVPAFARQLGVAAVVAVGCCVGLSGGTSRACA